MTFTIDKDPDADLDYSMDWSSWLTGSELIDTSSWDVSHPEIIIHGDGLDTSKKIATVYVSGGNPGKSAFCDLTNTVVTNSVPPRTEQRTIRLNMVQR